MHTVMVMVRVRFGVSVFHGNLVCSRGVLQVLFSCGYG